MNQVDVAIVGAGPTGLFLARELKRHGITAALYERKEEKALNTWSKALAVHARTLEIFERYPFIDQFLSLGIPMRTISILESGDNPVGTLDIVKYLESKYKIVLSIPQYKTEEILRNSVKEAGVAIHWGYQLKSLKESVDKVSLTFDTPNGEELVTSKWVVGCDGGHSVVRHAADVPFEGEDLEQIFAMASVKIEHNKPRDSGFVVFTQEGPILLIPEPEDRIRIISIISQQKAEEIGAQPSLEYFQNLLSTHLGPANPVLSDPHWLTIFKVRQRLAAKYRKGRILLAGDAAHTHSPAGGQGMNTGLQDVFNLAWKLALVIKGVGRTSLLDSYEEERRPVAASLLKGSGFTTKVAASTNTAVIKGIRQVVISTVSYSPAIKHRMAQVAGMLDISYSGSSIVKDASQSNWGWVNVLGKKHVSVGERVPFLSLTTKDESKVEFPELFFEPVHTLVVFLGEPNLELLLEIQQSMERYNGFVNTILIFARQLEEAERPLLDNQFPQFKIYFDLDHSVGSTFNVNETGMILVRPDSYVGFKSTPLSIPSLMEYLTTVVFF